MATASARSRRSSGPGTGQWFALGAAAILILGLTFALGVLIGRQWARQMPPAAAADSGKKAASAARRSGLAEAGMERPPELAEKLTFYQTLTAPLNTGGKGEPAHRPEAPPRPTAAPVSAPTAVVDEAPPRVAEPTPASSPAPPPAAAPEPAQARAKPEAPSQWTVQVAAFKARAQAEKLQKHLASAGFDAYVTEKGGEGQAQFRVRVGSFKTREEATRLAERVKAERSLAAFVTTK